jgi:hypothetical protein
MKTPILVLSSLLMISCTNIGTQITNKSGTVQLASTTANSTASNPVYAPSIKPSTKPIIKPSPKPEVVTEVEITTISRQVVDSYIVIQ